jgi:hypothetical protein
VLKWMEEVVTYCVWEETKRLQDYTTTNEIKEKFYMHSYFIQDWFAELFIGQNMWMI